MSAILKKIERKVGQAQDEQKTSSLTDTLVEIRREVATRNVLSDQEEEKDNETTIQTLEALVLRLCDVLESTQETQKAAEKECSRLEIESQSLVVKCEKLEKETIGLREALVTETQKSGKFAAEKAKYEAMYESENRARLTAETLFLQAKAEAKAEKEEAKAEQNRCHSMIEKIMEKPVEQQVIPPAAKPHAGWNMDVQRDGAGKIMRLILIPKGDAT